MAVFDDRFPINDDGGKKQLKIRVLFFYLDTLIGIKKSASGSNGYVKNSTAENFPLHSDDPHRSRVIP